MQKLAIQLEIDLAYVSLETAALWRVIMSAISDAIAANADAADGALAKANAEIERLKAEAATPEDMSKLEGTTAKLNEFDPAGSAPTPPVVPPVP